MPHYLLTSQVDRTEGTGRWRFVLRSDAGHQRFEASDAEPGIAGERLDLLTVIRALEALDQPSRVTLVDCSDYVWKGIRFGLPEWRTNGWRWEFFGQMVPVKNSDLWQRLDRALRFHDVECKRRRFHAPHQGIPGTRRPLPPGNSERGLRDKLSDWLRVHFKTAEVVYPGPQSQPRWRIVKSALKYASRLVPNAWRQRLARFARSSRRWVSRPVGPRTACP